MSHRRLVRQAFIAVLASFALLVTAPPLVATAAPGDRTITGHVALGSAAVAAGSGEVQVTAVGVGTANLPPVLTNSAGDFSIATSVNGLSSATYTLRFDYLGVSTDFSSVMLGGDPVGFGAGTTFDLGPGSKSAADVVMVGRASISGVVTVGGNVPIYTVDVTYQRFDPTTSAWGPDSAPLRVNSSGQFAFPALLAGYYRFAYDYQFDEYNAGYPTSYQIKLIGSNQTLQSKNLYMPGSFHGRVYLRTTPDGEGEVPVGEGDVVITLAFAGASYGGPYVPLEGVSATTDADGAFQFGKLEPGYYNLTYTWRGDGQPYADASYHGASVTAGVNESIGAMLSPLVLISGHVAMGASTVPARLGEVDVSLWSRVGINSRLIASTSTDADGNWHMTVPGQSELFLSFESPTNAFATYYLTELAFVEDTTFDAVVPLDESSISGIATSSSGAPVQGAVAQLYAYWRTGPNADEIAATQYAYTDDDGRFVLRDIEDLRGSVYYSLDVESLDGTYANVNWPDASYYYRPYFFTLPNKGIFTGFDVTMLRPGNISGKVSGSGFTTTPATTYVEVIVFDDNTQGWVRTGDIYPIAADGTYQIPGMYPDGYQIIATYNGPGGQGSLTSPILDVHEGGSYTFNPTIKIGLNATQLLPGTLVKSSSSPTIYLVDGASKLVKVSSASSAAEAGISPNVAIVPQAALSAYTIPSSKPLSNVIACSGQRYVAAEGKVWPVTYALVSGMASTALDATTCATLPKSTTTIRGGVFLSAVGATTIFAIQPDGTRRTLLGTPSAALAAAGVLSAPNVPVVLHVGSAFLSALPLGASVIPPGSLVKTAGSTTVYLADGLARLVPLGTTGVAADAGLTSPVLTVAASDLATYVIAATPLKNVISCGGATYLAGSSKIWAINSDFVAGIPATALAVSTCGALPRGPSSISRALFAKSIASATVYNIVAGSKRPLLSLVSVDQLSAPDVGVTLVVNDAFLASLTTGPSVLPQGGLIKSATNSTIYMVDGLTNLLRVRTTDAMVDFGLSATVYTVPDATITSRTTAPASLSNLVQCGGKRWLAAQGQLREIGAAAIGSLPLTSPSTSLCSVLPKNATALPVPTYIKSAAWSKIYLLDAGTKTSIGSASQYVGSSTVTWVTVGKMFADTIPG